MPLRVEIRFADGAHIGTLDVGRMFLNAGQGAYHYTYCGTVRHGDERHLWHGEVTVPRDRGALALVTACLADIERRR